MATETITTIARPYAKAAFEFALANNALQKWSDLLLILATACLNHQVKERVQTPGIAAEELVTFLIDVCGDYADEHGKNFIKLLAANKRLLALPEIKAIFEYMKSEHEKTVEVTVSSFEPMSDSQREALSVALKRRLGRDVTISETVDKSILGGAIIRAGDLVIDGSVRGKLKKLEAEIAA